MALRSQIKWTVKPFTEIKGAGWGTELGGIDQEIGFVMKF